MVAEPVDNKRKFASTSPQRRMPASPEEASPSVRVVCPENTDSISSKIEELQRRLLEYMTVTDDKIQMNERKVNNSEAQFRNDVDDLEDRLNSASEQGTDTSASLAVHT